MSDWLILALGAVAAGYVNGLAGFGTALFSLGFWLTLYPPQQAVAMSVVVAIATGLQGLWMVRHQIRNQSRRLLRFLWPALLGLPLGVIALAWIAPGPLRLLIAVFMLTYGAFFLMRRSLPSFTRPTPWLDRGIGGLAGILGGLAGLSGALPAMWCALRPWPRAETRAVLQPFNFVVLVSTMAALALRGAYTPQIIQPLAVALILALIAAQAGLATFRRLSDTQFRWVVIGLMLVSGAVLLIRTLMAG